MTESQQAAQGIYLVWLAMGAMITVRIAETVQRRRERRRVSLDMPELWKSLRNAER